MFVGFIYPFAKIKKNTNMFTYRKIYADVISRCVSISLKYLAILIVYLHKKNCSSKFELLNHTTQLVLDISFTYTCINNSMFLKLNRYWRAG